VFEDKAFTACPTLDTGREKKQETFFGNTATGSIESLLLLFGDSGIVAVSEGRLIDGPSVRQTRVCGKSVTFQYTFDVSSFGLSSAVCVCL
jgi:hypothetical protein